MMPNRVSVLAVSTLCICASVAAQETSSGISVPITISGELRQAHESGEAASLGPGFRAVLSPSVRFGPHWFIYAALDAHSSSYFPYEVGIDDDRSVHVELMQAFVGYVRSSSKGSILIKAGQISSAFGLFPIDYDDAKMPLVNPPLAYTANLPLRADQLPCGAEDIIRQSYDSGVGYHCGGSNVQRYGLTPVTLYGLPSVEVQLSLSRFDARLQITNSSPANPHGLFSESQSLQWTAGGGYTFAQGLHVGVSGFRGPYLDNNLTPLLPDGIDIKDFRADGIGVDARWLRGPWSAQGEWMQFHFALPGFIRSPSKTAAYVDVKRIISPRIFAAARVNLDDSNRIKDESAFGATRYAGPQQLYEATVGYRLNREQLLKVGAGWRHGNSWISPGWFWPPTSGYSVELQLVTSFTAVSKAFH